VKAARIHRYGSPEVIVLDELPMPTPAAGEVLIRVAAAGVGPWDALIREKEGEVNVRLPITLGSDLSGVVESVGSGVSRFKPDDRIYGSTNPQFIGAYAEYALVQANMIAPMPKSLSFEQAASVPVIAVTAWQMLFDYAMAHAGQSVLIHGAAGNVGAYAVQLAHRAALRIFATASTKDADFVSRMGATTVIDYKSQRFEDNLPPVDIVLDMVGGETAQRSLQVIKRGGILVSVVAPVSPDSSRNVRTKFFLVEVSTERLEKLTELFDRGELKTRVGTVLPLDQARAAHEMLGGAPHKPGKILLSVTRMI
jgi:NADPH:quinone reductase-like Zn-dependent oxidoreductase